MLIEAPNDEKLLEILANSKTIAIVGVSNKPDRPSYRVAEWLINNSHWDIHLVNPVITELFGLPVFSSLADVPKKIDIVDVFRNLSDSPGVLREAINVGAKTFWLQLGLSSQEIYDQAVAANLNIVMNRCSKIEYERLMKL